MSGKTKHLLGNLTRNKPEPIVEDSKIEQQQSSIDNDLVSETPVKEIKTLKPKVKAENQADIKIETLAKTFYISKRDLKTIEDFVSLRRMEGNLRYPQKMAINEAFVLLREAEKKGKIIHADTLIDTSERKQKTLSILSTDFEYIDEMYRKRRLKGETKYTQVDAVREALELLRRKYPTID